MTALRLPFATALALLIPAYSALAASAQDGAAYVRVTNERADKIVAMLDLADPAKAHRVRDAIAGHYRDLNAIQESRDARIKSAQSQPAATKEAIDTAKTAAAAEAGASVAGLHGKFLSKLAADLTPGQIDQVKDGLTYGVLPLTFRVYQQMLPNLTTDQRDQILAWLTEAREHAIDGFTSDEKHAWFGKYKGKINNYLSKAGYNMKDAEKNLTKKP